jgi:RimJ/RimL family protein N-acetyltransferase
MKLLYDFAFDTLKLQRICGTIAADNRLMTKWQKYLGMTEEGRLRRHYFINGHYQDAILLGLLSEEYDRVTRPRMRVLMAAGRFRD